MTDLRGPERPDPYDVQRVHHASGLLRRFNDAGVLGAADVHVAMRLGRLGSEDDERVLLAAALTVRALQAGSVCLDIATAQDTTAVEGADAADVATLGWPPPDLWATALAGSPLVAVEGRPAEGDASRPLRLVGALLYLDRYWRQEQRIATVLDEAAARPAPAVDADLLGAALTRLFPDAEPDRQRLAAVVAAHRWVSVLAGGPGTGKTTTVAKLLALLQDQADGSLRVALAAPSAVAAARLTLAARAVAQRFDEQDRARLGSLEASTLHRLLGRRPGSRTRFRHDRENRLPFDVVVVDEASMVSLTMMSRLVDALRPGCRLVLVGDPDQLASIEAGAVLGDLVHRDAHPDSGGRAPVAFTQLVPHDVVDLAADERIALERGVVRLAQVHRFSSQIADLAEAVRSGDPEQVADVLAQEHPSIEFVDTDIGQVGTGQIGTGQVGTGQIGTGQIGTGQIGTGQIGTGQVGTGRVARGRGGGSDLAALREDVVTTGVMVHEAALAGDGDRALRELAGHRLLCAHRHGPYGVTSWSQQAEDWLREAVSGYAVAGRWYVGRPLLLTSNDYQLRLFNGDTGVVVDVDGRARAAFVRDGVVELFAPSRLSDVQTVHAMSVHRSQGSQFERITLVLPPADSPLLTRELLYTGLTRAKERVRIVGTRAALEAAVRRPIIRASGLRLRP